jgi:AcrR family transcriptional regulator
VPTLASERAVNAQSDEGSWPKVLAAARSCFLQYGVRKTSIADIADAAGLARQSIYRYANNKSALVDAALLARLGEMDAGLREILDRTNSFQEAVIEGSVAVVISARNDRELNNLMEASRGRHLSELTASSSAAMHTIVLRVWQPLLDRGREIGWIRADADDDQLVEWIRGVYLMLFLRTDLDSDGYRRLIRTFLVPSLHYATDRSD